MRCADLETTIERSRISLPMRLLGITDKRPVVSQTAFVMIERMNNMILEVAVVEEKGKKIRTKSGWEQAIGFPGGGVKTHKQETSREAAVRETREECSLLLAPLSVNQIIYAVRLPDQANPHGDHEFIVYHTVDFEGKIAPGREIEKAYWMPLKDLLESCRVLRKHLEAACRRAASFPS